MKFSKTIKSPRAAVEDYTDQWGAGHSRGGSTTTVFSKGMKNYNNTTGQGADVSTNKYLRNNIKKMKIGQNYAQLVTYAKSKLTH